MNKDLTQGNSMKIIVFFSIPILLGNLFQQLYNMVDTIIVGRFIGDEALAAVGTTGCLMFLVLGFANGIAQGFGVMIAQAYGAGNYKQLKHYVALILVLTVVVSLFLSVPTTLGARELLKLLNTPEEAGVLKMATEYIQVIFAGILLTMAYNVEAGILRGIGDSKTPLYFLFLASVLNIIMDVVFIVVFNMGTAGAAYATVIGQGVAAALCFGVIYKKFPIIRVGREDFYNDPRAVGKLLRLGIPMAINYSITAVGTMILQGAINSFGAEVMPAYTAASKVVNITTQTMPTLGTTAATYCGQNMGAGKYKRIYKGMRDCFIICLVIGILAAAMCMLLGPWLVGLFMDKPSAQTMEYAMMYLKRSSLCMIPLAWIFVYRNGMQGLGKAFIPMMCGVVELVTRFVVIAVLKGPFGYKGVCWTDGICWIVTGVMVLVAYGIWEIKHRKLLLMREQ